MEHRWGRRVAVDIPIRIGATLFSAKRGLMTNLSLSGAFIKTTVDMRVLSHLQVVLDIPGRPRRETVSVMGYVARKAEDGIGVEWFDFAPSVVAEIIRAAAPDQAPLISQRERVAAPF